MSVQREEDKKWVGWFRPLSRGWREGSLIAVPIEILRDSDIQSKRKHLVVSVPSSCGCAAKRNRFRRIVRAHFEKHLVLGSRTGVWIRLLNRHRLDHKIQIEDWQIAFDKVAARFSF